MAITLPGHRRNVQQITQREAHGELKTPTDLHWQKSLGLTIGARIIGVIWDAGNSLQHLLARRR